MPASFRLSIRAELAKTYISGAPRVRNRLKIELDGVGNMNKKILIIHGHPRRDSYCSALAAAYKKGALESGTEVQEIVVTDLKFNSVFDGDRQKSDLELDLLKAQELVRWAEHLVFVYPNWWGTMPALLKGFMDRAFNSGFAFKYRSNSPWWDRLLQGKSARLIVTMDTPPWYYRFVFHQPGHHAMKNAILEFCGISPVRISSIGSIKASNLSQRQKWLEQLEHLGRKSL
jgi:NAD(P)H dehydrogenase (quinone)